MAIAIDSAASAQALSATGLSWSHTCSGSERLLIVFGCLGSTSGLSATATYNGVSMTQFAVIDDGTWNRIVGFYLINPASGANTVAITYSVTHPQLGGGSVSFTGAHQTTALGTAATGANHTNTSNTVNVSSASGEITICGTATDDETGITVGSPATQQWQQGNIGSDTTCAASTDAGAATVTMSWTQDIAGWATIGVGLKPSGGGGATPSLMLPQKPMRHMLVR